jgi:hypothetical protein
MDPAPPTPPQRRRASPCARLASAMAVAFGIAALAAGPGGARACGLEDPGSLSALRGGLNMAFPEALHVGTAVWQAQLAGRLPRDPLSQRADLPPEARATLRMARAGGLLRQFALRVDDDGVDAARPNLAVVLLGSVLWTRFEAGAPGRAVQVHAPGPQPGDVVVVTDLPVIEAIAAGSLSFADALSMGVLRLYGPPAQTAAAATWLTRRPRA